MRIGKESNMLPLEVNVKKNVFNFIKENDLTEFSILVDMLQEKESFMLEDVLEEPYIYIEYINSRRRARGMV